MAHNKTRLKFTLPSEAVQELDIILESEPLLIEKDPNIHAHGAEARMDNENAQQAIKTRQAAQLEQVKIPKDLASSHVKGKVSRS